MKWKSSLLTTPLRSNPEPQDGGFDITPARIRIWIEQLPLANLDASFSLLTGRIKKIRLMQASARSRYKALEILDEPVAYLSTSLAHNYNRSPLPLSSKAKEAAFKARQLHAEMAMAYSAIARESTLSTKLGRHTGISAASIHRSLRHLGNILLTSYQTYAPHPQGVWETIHDLYGLAEQRKLLIRPVREDAVKGKRYTHIPSTYNHILLLALANPCCLTQREIGALDENLASWSPLCHLYPVSGNNGSAGIFVVNPSGDTPPSYRAHLSEEDLPKIRILDTSGLVQKLQNHIASYRHAISRHRVAAIKGNGVAQNLDYLRHLLAMWDIPPTRDAPRITTPSHASVVLGITGASYFIGGRDASMTSSYSTGQESTSVNDNTATHPAYSYAPHACAVLNETTHGVCLATTAAIPSRIRVGEILAFEHRDREREPPWEIGIIRWLKNMNGGQIHFGVQKLASNAKPLMTKLSHNPSTDRDPLHGLLLAEMKANAVAHSVILPTRMYNSGDSLHAIRKNGEELHIELTQTMEETGTIDRFHCTVATLSGQEMDVIANFVNPVRHPPPERIV